VEHGDRRGRTIGFPTANVKPNDANKLVPARGVYAVKVIVTGQTHDAMLNIGVRPTVDGTRETIEAHILDFDGDVYGQPVDICFYKRLRDEQKFNGLDELKAQLERDRETTRRYFAS
jgi:riboflavin kinase/FMN adenylyltransferase